MFLWSLPHLPLPTSHTPLAPILKKMAALSSSVRSWVTTSTSMTPSFSTPPQTPQHFLAFPSVSMEGGRWWRSFTLRLFQFNHSIVIDSSKVKKYVKLKPCQDDFYSCFEVEQHNRMFSFLDFDIFAGLHLQRDWLQTVWLTCIIRGTSQWGKCICKRTEGSNLFQVISSNMTLVLGKRAARGAQVLLSGADLHDGLSHHWARLGEAKASFWKRTMLFIVGFFYFTSLLHSGPC